MARVSVALGGLLGLIALCTVGVVGGAAPAAADAWLRVHESVLGDTYVDDDSIGPAADPGILRARVKEVFKKDVRSDARLVRQIADMLAQLDGDTFLLAYEVNCAAGELALREQKLLPSEQPSHIAAERQRWHAAFVASEHAVLAHLCKK